MTWPVTGVCPHLFAPFPRSKRLEQAIKVTALSSTEGPAGFSPSPPPPPPPLRYKEASVEERAVTAKKCTKECDACANCYFFEVFVAVAVVVVKASK